MKLYDEIRRQYVLSETEEIASNKLRDQNFKYTNFSSITQPWLEPRNIKLYPERVLAADAEDRELFEQDFAAYTAALAQNTVYETLAISDFYLDEARAIQLGRALGKNRGIRKLKLEKNLLGANIRHIISALVENETMINELIIEDNEIGDAELLLILPLFQGRTKIKTLSLKRGTLGGSEVVFSSHGISTTTFTAYGVIHLAAALHNALHLETLSLYGFSLGEEGGILFATALQNNPPLKRLILNRTEIGDKAAASFSVSLPDNTTLIDLDLKHNNITAVGAIDLMQCLPYNKKLKFFNLSSNPLGNDAGKHIAEMIANSTTLFYLSLNNCSITDLKAISEGVKQNSTLRGLSIRNQLDDKNIGLLVNAVLEEKTSATNNERIIFIKPNVRFISIKPYAENSPEPIQKLNKFAAGYRGIYNVRDDLSLVRGWELFKRQNLFSITAKDRLKLANGEIVTQGGIEVTFDENIMARIAKFVAQSFCITKSHPRAGIGI